MPQPTIADLTKRLDEQEQVIQKLEQRQKEFLVLIENIWRGSSSLPEGSFSELPETPDQLSKLAADSEILAFPSQPRPC